MFNGNSFWGFQRTFGESPRSFFESIRSEVRVEQASPRLVSTVEFEDEEFVVTKFSASSDQSFSQSSNEAAILNPEEL